MQNMQAVFVSLNLHSMRSNRITVVSLQGFTFPPEAGYPLDSRQVQFYLMETHYNNPDFVYDAATAVTEEQATVDSSGLRLYVTAQTRRYDAGVMTVGKKIVVCCWL